MIDYLALYLLSFCKHIDNFNASKSSPFQLVIYKMPTTTLSTRELIFPKLIVRRYTEN